MKKLITCASLAAVGAMTVDAQPIGDPSKSKLWSVSAKLRGFYDDNYNTGPDQSSAGLRPAKADSWGISFAPSVGFNVIKEMTTFNAQVDYQLRWFEARTDNQIDHMVLANLELFHDFSENYRLELKDRFAYSDEPTVLEPGMQSNFLRTDNSNIRNYAGAGFLADFSETMGSRLGYENTYYNYDEEGDGSRSALLDRMEHLISIDARRRFQPTTVGLLGYQFGMTDMSSNDRLASPAAVGLPPLLVPTSSYRNQRSHYGFVGADHQLSTTLSAQARVGVQYADFYNAGQDYTAPYADAAVGYTYREGCRVTVGVRHGINATDVGMMSGSTQVTLATESTMVYAAVSHRITPKLVGFLRGSWQGVRYLGGPWDSEYDNFWTVDVNLTYELTQYVALEAGYLFDSLDSQINDNGERSYNRNRGYLGVKATY